MQRLFPSLNLLSEEYVLVQAWKKSAAQIRYHNWFSDTLELDRAAADLPNFIARLSDQLKGGRYETSPLKLVPAPKSQSWHVDSTGLWRPLPGEKDKIRPLAHVSLSDQVVATAVLLCLSERVETAQGDPRDEYAEEIDRQKVASYGNRLFCDRSQINDGLVHRWGSSKLYRAYFHDYRTFLNRPESVASNFAMAAQDVYIVQTDLKQFYDRVTPELLQSKIAQLRKPGDDEQFFSLATDILNWGWNKRDQRQFELYKERLNIPGFERVALPQGLVAAGFFSNVVMLDFDKAALGRIGDEIAPGVWLQDVCRYVDDIRLTITVNPDLSPSEAQESSIGWIARLLDEHCAGQQVSPEKTRTASVGRQEQPLVRQSRKMERIQSAISGGFDASGGAEVISAIEALVRSQDRLWASPDSKGPVNLQAVADVKDETVGRFAAGRFRKTYRSLRPLLDNHTRRETLSDGQGIHPRDGLTQEELDDEAHAFALTLIQRWIADPSNVRLLRVALDLWPSKQILSEVLKLIDPYLSGEINIFSSRRIVYYCLAEILRAGATETGFIKDEECLPSNVDVIGYRKILLQTAIKIVRGQANQAPWYLVQQALLFISVHDPLAVEIPKHPKSNSTYWRLLSFLQGACENLSDREFAILSILSRRSFMSKDEVKNLVVGALTTDRFSEIAARDIEFASDLTQLSTKHYEVASGIADDIGRTEWVSASEVRPLVQLVQKDGPLNSLRNEIGVLSFALRFLHEAKSGVVPPVVTPSTLQVSTEPFGQYSKVREISFRSVQVAKGYKSIYSAPSWVEETQRWRFQLGYLLRYILTAKVDFGMPVRPTSWKEVEPLYRPTRAHWMQRHYGFFNGHEAFGDDWLPISQFTQELLFSLLIWPGCQTREQDSVDFTLELAIERVETAFEEAQKDIGAATGTLMLKIDAPMPGSRKSGRPLRACVVQSIMPEEKDLLPDPKDMSSVDLEIRNPVTRRKHRRHLATTLAAIEKMLDLRRTHKPENKSLDWIIFPELSVHPDDVEAYLVPFARSYKTAILAGIGYERLLPAEPLVNSALWIIPTAVPGKGLQMVIRRQGKQHLSPMETPFNKAVETIAGFRPCQWLVGYEWSADTDNEPLWLSASICYDATDLKLASDLRDRSDVFAIPALNQDVGTFDQMAQALHYHMFQMVIIANNGTFGGSNAYSPKGGSSFTRQVFHTHGQPQAAISFFEIEEICEMKKRRELGKKEDKKDRKGWKYPPAGS